MKRWSTMIGLLFTISAGGVGALSGQETEERKALVLSAENLMAGDARHQEIAAKGGNPETVLPGDVIRYRLRFTNLTEAPVRNVVFQNPVAGGLRYVTGTAGADREDVIVEYSIDGGRSYLAEPMIEELIEGRPVLRPAPAERYTHVRWTVRGWVDPGAQVTAEFQARFNSNH